MYTHVIRKYYSAMRKKEMPSFATTWMDLESSEIGQRKTHITWYHLYVKYKIND